MDQTKDKERIQKALKAMVALRAGKIDAQTLNLYSTRLTKEFLPDVMRALEKISELPRAEFETAVPDIATILSMAECERIARENRAAAAKSERLVRWQCTENPAHTFSGYPSTGDSLERRCNGIPKTRKTDWKPEDGRPICGARMTVVHDDNEETDSGPLVKWESPWAERSGAR